MPNIIKIDNLSMPELKVYTITSEVQLLRCHEPDPGVFIAESPRVIERAMDAGYSPISFLVETRYLEMAAKDLKTGGLKAEETENQAETGPPGKENTAHPHAAQIMQVIRRGGDVPVYTAGIDLLEELTGFHLTSGMVSAMTRRKLPPLEEVLKGASRIVLLEDITNPTNVGAIFRSAAALNMDAVLLTKDCSDPLYRRSIRVSMGTVFQIPWTMFDKHLSYPHEVMDHFHAMGMKTAAMVLDRNSVKIDDENLMKEEKLVIVLGAEGDGLKKDTIADCDYKVCIPMSHGVDSLNVAAAGAVAFWQLSRRPGDH